MRLAIVNWICFYAVWFVFVAKTYRIWNVCESEFISRYIVLSPLKEWNNLICFPFNLSQLFLETQSERIIFPPDRTTIRNRFLSLKDSNF